ncbi:hypothetical protein GCM10009827_007440 [Dactylosporangium maewongense]|uniref:Uncharacterized protein n=1 Tax=Dactylosporangium maewongense TaxID=634393 RepID=A0ABN1ZLB8_9ACTN
MLWADDRVMVLRALPGAHLHEERDRGLTVPFTVNLGLLLSREIRMHRALEPGPVRHQRLATLDRHAAARRERLRAAT